MKIAFHHITSFGHEIMNWLGSNQGRILSFMVSLTPKTPYHENTLLQTLTIPRDGRPRHHRQGANRYPVSPGD